MAALGYSAGRASARVHNQFASLRAKWIARPFERDAVVREQTPTLPHPLSVRRPVARSAYVDGHHAGDSDVTSEEIRPRRQVDAPPGSYTVTPNLMPSAFRIVRLFRRNRRARSVMLHPPK
jgi:hypothetical protein